MALRRNKPSVDPVLVAQLQQHRERQEVSTAFQKGITALRDFIAPKFD